MTDNEIDWKGVAERAAGHIDTLLLYARDYPHDSHPRDAATFLANLRRELGLRGRYRMQGQFKEDGFFLPFPRLPQEPTDD